MDERGLGERVGLQSDVGRRKMVTRRGVLVIGFLLVFLAGVCAGMWRAGSEEKQSGATCAICEELVSGAPFRAYHEACLDRSNLLAPIMPGNAPADLYADEKQCQPTSESATPLPSAPRPASAGR